MKKIFISAALIGSAVAFAQSGKVGVNVATPQATLDIQPSAANAAATATTNEGLLIPRLTKARVTAIAAANLVEGTQVYVTDDVTAGDNATFTGTGKGFYYYDAAAARWVKMGAGTAAVTTAQNGLSMNGTAVELGGALTKPTTITGSSTNSLNLTGTYLNLNQTELRLVTPGVDAPDLSFNSSNGVIGRVWSNPTGFGLRLAGHNPSLTGIPGVSGDTILQVPDLEIISTGEVRLNQVNANSSNQVLVRDTTTGVIGYRDASSLAGTSANIYNTDGSLTADRTLDFNGKTLTYSGTGKLAITGADAQNVGLDISTIAKHTNELYMQAATGTDAPDIQFRNAAGKVIGRIYSNTATNGLHFGGHDAASSSYTTDTALASPDLSILPSGEIAFYSITQNDASNMVLVYGQDGKIQWRAASTLAGTPASATTASNGLTATGSNVTLGGTLTQATTVSQGANTMTFTNDGSGATASGTGKFVVNGATNLNGAVIYKTRGVTGVLTLQNDDYMIIKTDAGNTTWNLGTAVDGRKICIFNDSPGSGDITITPQPGGLYGGTIYHNSGVCYISYGGKWYGSEGGN